MPEYPSEVLARSETAVLRDFADSEIRVFQKQLRLLHSHFIQHLVNRSAHLPAKQLGQTGARDTGFAEQRYRSLSDTIELPALGISLPLSEIYYDTGLE